MVGEVYKVELGDEVFPNAESCSKESNAKEKGFQFGEKGQSMFSSMKQKDKEEKRVKMTIKFN